MPCLCLTVTMAVPPCYADLGKSAKDIFNKGYGIYTHTLMLQNCNVPFSPSLKEFMSLSQLFSGFGTVKLDVKTKSASGVVRPCEHTLRCFLNKA